MIEDDRACLAMFNEKKENGRMRPLEAYSQTQQYP
jgi:hypothetical protein